MPRPLSDYCVPAIVGAVDTTEWEGEEIFSRNTATIEGPEYPEELAFDAVEWLNGHGSYYNLEKLLNDAVQASSHPNKANIEFTVTLNYATDKVTIQCNLYNFSLIEGGTAFEEQLGFTNGTGDWASSPAYSGVVSTLVAPADWIRGEFLTSNIEIELDPGGTITSLNFGASGYCQDVPILLRNSGPTDADYAPTGDADADDRSDNLSIQSVDNEEVGSYYIRWGLIEDSKDSGLYVYVSYLKTFADITWSNSAFMERCGFTGDESPVSLDSNYEYIVASNPMPGVYKGSRPADELILETELIGGAIPLTDGSFASNLDAIFHKWRATMYLDGPGEDSQTNTYIHYHKRVLPYLYHGMPVSFYQDWGDSRRASEYNYEDYSVLYTNDYDSTRDYNNTLYTRGRIVGYVSLNNATTQQTNWPNNFRIRSPITFWIKEATEY